MGARRPTLAPQLPLSPSPIRRNANPVQRELPLCLPPFRYPDAAVRHCPQDDCGGSGGDEEELGECRSVTPKSVTRIFSH